MAKRILTAFLVAIFLVSIFALAAGAATYVDTDAAGSLTLTYGYDGRLFSDVPVRIYRVAEISAYADFTPVSSFADLPVEINKIKTQDEWRQLASTLSSYVTANQIAADQEMATNSAGVANFTSVPLGLYLVKGVRVDLDDGYCQFDSFMISVPSLDADDRWVYDVVAKPKSVYREVLPEQITYTVNKLWKDEGHIDKRPQTVTLELYCDGNLAETVELSSDNNWTYAWTAEDNGSLWQVVERDIPRGYKVTTEQKDTRFLVTNAYDVPGNPPSTGDITNVDLYVVLMCISGLGLVILGIAAGRRKKA